MAGSEDRSFEAMRLAARIAEDFRREIAVAERTPTASYAEVIKALRAPLPETGGDAVEIIENLNRLAREGLRSPSAPRFFGWVMGGSHLTGVAADFLTSAWGQNTGNVQVSPSGSAFEAVVVDWILELLDLPRSASVGVVTGATVANFVGLSAARSSQLAKQGWDVEADGLYGAPPLRVLIGADAHTTVYGALKFLGLGAKRVREIATDDLGRMLPSDFERALGEDDAPAIAIGQCGQINTGASDPFAEIAPMAREAGAWLHVDSAFGLWSRSSPKLKHLAEGLDLADSWAVDGHKWLQTPYDCGFAIVRDVEAHRRAMSFSASYLPVADTSERNPSDYVPELSRRARGFAAWAMIRQLGRDGIARMVESNVDVAQAMATSMAQIDGVELVCPVELNQFMVRIGDTDEVAEGDRLTLATVEQLQRDAMAFAGPAQWRGRWVIRFSVISAATTPEDGDMTVEALRKAWETVRNAN